MFAYYFRLGLRSLQRNLVLTAGGLVTETGAVMAHGPTVAREYGIPAVICVPGATQKIKTGQVITVDGAAGTVTIGH